MRDPQYWVAQIAKLPLLAQDQSKAQSACESFIMKVQQDGYEQGLKDERIAAQRQRDYIAKLEAVVEEAKSVCQASAECLPISDKAKRIDIEYYRAKLIAIDRAASVLSQALASVNNAPKSSTTAPAQSAPRTGQD